MLGLRLGLGSGGGASPYANASYSLAIDADDQSYWSGGTRYSAISSVPGYTSTRTGEQGAVNSTGAVAFFAANVPAINDVGYHAYVALTNALLYSQDFVNAGWIKSTTAPTLTAGQADPAGGTAAVIVNDTSATVFENIYQTITIPADTLTRTFSIFVKKFTSAGQRFGINPAINGGTAINGNVRFDPFTGVVTAIACTAYVIDCGGWWRLVITITNNGSAGNTSFNISIFPATAATGTGSDSATPTGAVTLYQAQILTGEFRDGGPLITTTTAAATIGAPSLRVNDAPTDVDQLFFATVDFPNILTLTRRLAEWSNGTDSTNLVSFAVDTTGAIYTQVTVASVMVYNGALAYALTGKVTLVLRRSGGSWRGGYVRNGVLTWLGADTAATFPAGLAVVNIGSNRGGTLQINAPQPGVFRKLGSFTTDAQVLAAVAETA